MLWVGIVCLSYLHGVTRVDETHFLVKFTHFHGYSGFTGTRVTSEYVMQRRNSRFDTETPSERKMKRKKKISFAIEEWMQRQQQQSINQ